MKQITITVPDNCELKQDGNTYTIVEKEKKVDYDDIAKELFATKRTFFTNRYGAIGDAVGLECNFSDPNNCTSERQAEKLLAINKLMNVAKYLNGDWQPDWNNTHENKYYIFVENEQINIDYMYSIQCSCIYFKSKELAKQAIEILGEEIIKLALCTDY